MKKALFIVNPKSGLGRIKNELLNILSLFTQNGYFASVFTTTCQGSATEFICNNTLADYDICVVCGGDGTLNEVITGFMMAGFDIPLGYVPAGTLNEWSSGLKISRNIKKAAEDILASKIVTLDLGKFNDDYFCYTASFGAFTEASYSAPQNVKNVLGQAAYLLEGIKKIGDIKPIHMQVKTATHVIEDDFLFGAVSNSMSLGGVLKFDSNVINLNDGMFEIVLIHKPSNILELQSIIDGLLKKDFTRRGLTFLHSDSVAFEGGENIPWTLDGEYNPGGNNIEIKNLHSALRLLLKA